MPETSYVSFNYSVIPAGGKYVIMMSDYDSASEGSKQSVLVDSSGNVVMYSSVSQAEAAIKAAVKAAKEASQVQ